MMTWHIVHRRTWILKLDSAASAQIQKSFIVSYWLIDEVGNKATPQGSLQSGDRVGGDRDALDGTLVAAPADAEVAALAPARAPAVLDGPVLLPGLVAAAVAHQQHGVVGQLEGVEGVSEARVVVDALLVVHEVGVDLAKDRDDFISIFLGQIQAVPVKQEGAELEKENFKMHFRREKKKCYIYKQIEIKGT